jgi:hypothetical protein
VNAVYGYNAISRIVLTQTAVTGFAEGQMQFNPAPSDRPAEAASITPEAAQTVAGVGDDSLRGALERLGQNILTRRKAEKDR